MVWYNGLKEFGDRTMVAEEKANALIGKVEGAFLKSGFNMASVANDLLKTVIPGGGNNSGGGDKGGGSSGGNSGSGGSGGGTSGSNTHDNATGMYSDIAVGTYDIYSNYYTNVHPDTLQHPPTTNDTLYAFNNIPIDNVGTNVFGLMKAKNFTD